MRDPAPLNRLIADLTTLRESPAHLRIRQIPYLIKLAKRVLAWMASDAVRELRAGGATQQEIGDQVGKSDVQINKLQHRMPKYIDPIDS